MGQTITLPITGPQIKALRRAQNINQTQMAKEIGCSRHAVSYWETQREPMGWRRIKWGVPARMLKALNCEVLPNCAVLMRARGDGVLDIDGQQAALDRECARANEKMAQRAMRARVVCGARTRKGRPCRMVSELGKKRCKFHGGMSTGPRTTKGKARIAEAQRQRWLLWHNGKPA